MIVFTTGYYYISDKILWNRKNRYAYYNLIRRRRKADMALV